MKTYQDLIALTTEDSKKSFIIGAINEYKSSPMYEWAVEGERYSRQLNTTIMRYQKLLYTMSGEAVPDNFTANHKCASNFFSRFVTQENQYLLGNGVTFENEATKDKLGGTDFDVQLQRAGKCSLVAGVSYGFFDVDHITVFKATEFVPLFDEENGSLSAGIRFWQIASDKPLRATLYELDGYTDYIDRDGALEILRDKKPYKLKVRTTVADGTEIYDGENYPAFPVVPLWANPDHQSELVGLKSEIDAYDLIKSGFANDLDDASMIYWTINNAGGMDDIDLAKFIERMKTVKATIIDGDGASAEAHTMDIPYQSREAYLTRLENDMYKDFMALNTDTIAGGAITATQIMASYEPLNNKTDQFEYCVDDFIKGLLVLIGVEDAPTFKRSMIVNQTEMTTMVLQASQYLDDETILKHLPFLAPEEVEQILDNLVKEEAERYEPEVEEVEVEQEVVENEEK